MDFPLTRSTAAAVILACRLAEPPRTHKPALPRFPAPRLDPQHTGRHFWRVLAAGLDTLLLYQVTSSNNKGDCQLRVASANSAFHFKQRLPSTRRAARIYFSAGRSKYSPPQPTLFTGGAWASFLPGSHFAPFLSQNQNGRFQKGAFFPPSPKR